MPPCGGADAPTAVVPNPPSSLEPRAIIPALHNLRAARGPLDILSGALAGLVDQCLQTRDLGLNLGWAEGVAALERSGLLRLQLLQQHLGLLDTLGQLQRLELELGPF